MATESSETVPTGAVRVFLLDDHELIRHAIRELLEVEEGIEVVGDSGSARSATTRILALRPDVAVLDVRLADGSGIAVCRSVRQRDPSIRALMLTTFDDTEMRLGAALAGASGFVIKDIRVADLVDAIRRVAAGDPLTPSQDHGAAPVDLTGDPLLRTLSPRERRVLDLVVEGLTNKEVGERLGIAEKTVRNHVTNVLAKLGLTRRTQAAVYAVTHDGPGGGTPGGGT